jgi:uracil phosphoribosyltransferase
VSKTNLSPNTILELKNLFEKRHWEIDESEDVKISLFQRYCDRLKYLDNDEQNLLIELSYNFQKFGIMDYSQMLVDSFNKIPEEVLKSKMRIIIAPLLRPFIGVKENANQVETPIIKSSHFIFYLFKTMDTRRLIKYFDKIRFCNNLTEINNNYIENKTLLILIDDFIGTGDTALDVCHSILTELSNKRKIVTSNIALFCIAAMEKGIQRIRSKTGIETYASFVQSRGISDMYHSDQAKENKSIMKKIENKLKCDERYSLGYGQSEALITLMDKTPNNTFPVFWHETETKIAPFPRYKKYTSNGID